VRCVIENLHFKIKCLFLPACQPERPSAESLGFDAVVLGLVRPLREGWDGYLLHFVEKRERLNRLAFVEKNGRF